MTRTGSSPNWAVISAITWSALNQIERCVLAEVKGGSVDRLDFVSAFVADMMRPPGFAASAETGDALTGDVQYRALLDPSVTIGPAEGDVHFEIEGDVTP